MWRKRSATSSQASNPTCIAYNTVMIQQQPTTRATGGVRYSARDAAYFSQRVLARHANVWHLWALGVGAVISGHFSGWNGGLLQGGWGGMLVATLIVGVMYLGLTFAIAEMSAALPHTGAAYSFARTAMGPWGGFLTGLAENVEYVLTPAVIVFFMGTYLTRLFGTPDAWQPLWWIAAYALFLTLNILGDALAGTLAVAPLRGLFASLLPIILAR